MSDNLFDDDSIDFLILVNKEQQYSIWPQSLSLPPGWECNQGPMSRQRCMDWLKQHWNDLRPLSLRQTQEQTL